MSTSYSQDATFLGKYINEMQQARNVKSNKKEILNLENGTECKFSKFCR